MKKRSQWLERPTGIQVMGSTPVGGTRKIFFPSIQLENALSFTLNRHVIHSLPSRKQGLYKLFMQGSKITSHDLYQIKLYRYRNRPFSSFY